jgi:hypothetical protein
LPSSYRIWTENGLFSPQCLYIFYWMYIIFSGTLLLF